MHYGDRYSTCIIIAYPAFYVWAYPRQLTVINHCSLYLEHYVNKIAQVGYIT